MSLFSHQVTSNSFWLHELQHTRLPCPSSSPGVCPSSCPLSWQCHPMNHLILCHPLLLPSISPSIRVFSNESALRIRWPKYWSFSFSISPSQQYSGWFPLGLTGWISLLSKGLSRVFSNTTVQKHQFFSTQPFLWSRVLDHICTWSRRVLTGQMRPLSARPTANKNYREASNLDYKHPQC